MSYQNGAVPASALTTIAGCQLLTGTARAFARWQAACAKEGIALTTWGKYSGYRPRAVQAGMRDAFLDRDLAAMARYGMDTTSKAVPAVAGTSRHGDALAVDIRVTKGSQARARELGKQFGFSWPFGADDVNHMLHDGRTATAAPKPVAKPARKSVLVHDGDNLSAIAAAHKLSLAKLKALNPQVVGPKFVIRAGQKLWLS